MAIKNLVHVATILEKQINVIKYTLHCITVIEWILAGFLFGLAINLRWDTNLQEWITILDIDEFYIGIYVLMFIGFVVLVLPVLSCVSVYQEITQLIFLNVAGHCGCFLLLMIGNGILMENSNVNTGIQDAIRKSMWYLMNHSYEEYNLVRLNMIQEEIGCCGVEGPNDYLHIRRPLPAECRDTVTGNAYYYGCSDEIAWLLNDKTSWLVGIAFTLGFLQMLIAVLSYVLIQALQKEEKLTYRR